MKLGDQQQWFARAVIAGEELEQAAQHLTPGPTLGARERLDVYRHGYEARLVECLADDYPILKHALGGEAFEALCRRYVASHPSESPSLNFYGRHMASFCEGFAADVAALEWAVVEAIHAPDGEALTAERLAAIPLEAWAQARLAKNPSLRVLRAQYPVNEYLQAVHDGREPELPAPAASATAVYRRGLTVWRQGLTPVMADVLSALAAGETLEAAVAPVPDDVPPGHLMGWFRDWALAGLFVGIELAS